MMIFSEMAVIMVLSFKNPFRKLVIMGLDRLKRGRGPVVVKTVAGTVFVVMMSNLYSVMEIQKRWADDGVTNPTNQILMIHHYIKELRIRRKSIDALRKKVDLDKVKSLEEEVTTLCGKLKQSESDIETKTKQISAAEVNSVALRKQSEGLLLEYDRLLEENENLRSQLKSLDWKLSQSDSKKNM
ncbi:peroxisomal membrane protein PMP22-like [Hibiscus syriacus]|uniref:Endoplasmic reticulum transmembrane protein n=1 Tax=Hibiscus syriacus TaxID=106335 RepID=A0A6A2ZCV1_HIBSY|nr:peroxisomal membrane protein PMP22-like [Hibiscus syriacus]